MKSQNLKEKLAKAHKTIRALQKELSETNRGLIALTLELEARTEELEYLNKELEAFSYSVSHDLRHPIMLIGGFSQALLEDCGQQLDLDSRDTLERIRTASRKMALLIDDLLKLSKVSHVEINREMVDLSTSVETIADELQKLDPSRRVTFVINKGLKVIGDADLLRIALENLLRNAWKFTRGHSTARIEFGRLEQAGETAYYVRDNGAGFDMAHSGKLFQAFERLHPQKDFEGTGIGLATVKRIFHRHGGRVWAEGMVEKGATFYFSL